MTLALAAAATLELTRRPPPPPPLDPAIERGLKLLETGDPEKALAEVLALRLYRDTRRLIEAAHEGGYVLAQGAHSTGKTYVLDAYALVWSWYACGCELDGDNRPKGAILALVANKADQVFRTTYNTIRRLGRLAADQGWELPGWKNSSEASVRWVAEAETWFLAERTFQRPAGGSGALTIDAAQGLKHAHRIIVRIEEAAALPPPMWQAVKSWQPQEILAAFNPYSAGGRAYELTKSPRWRTVTSSALDHPNVRERREIIEGAILHETVEEDLRESACERRGPWPETPVDAAHHDFVYALAPRDEPEAGPRDDDIPGHPRGEVAVWRPGPVFDAGRLGQFPVAREEAVFSEVAWRTAQEIEASLPPIGDLPPQTVGIDTAEGGPDRWMKTPRWGPSVRELWTRYRTALKTAASPVEAVVAALRCQECGGDGCPACYGGGLAYQRIGRAETVPKTQDAAEMARRLLKPWGAAPTYLIDRPSGGYWIAPHLRAAGATVIEIEFGGGPGAALEGQRLYLNQRAAMYGRVAAAVSAGMVALPPTPDDDALDPWPGCRVLEWETEARADGGGGKLTRWKLPDKLGVRAALAGRSPDAADSLVLTDGEGKRVVSAVLRG